MSKFEINLTSTPHVLIIAHDVATYEGYAEQLRNYGWKAATVGTFDEGLGYLAREHPEIVMISYNHDDEKLKSSSMILERRFGVQCVAFCERRTKNTAKVLLQSGLKNLLFPPITVDSIFEKILRMSKDKAKDGDKSQRKFNEKSAAPLNELFEPDSLSQYGKSVDGLFALPPPVHHRVQNQRSWFDTFIRPSLEQAFEITTLELSKLPDTVESIVVGVPIRCESFNGILVVKTNVAIEKVLRFTEAFADELRRLSGNMGQRLSSGLPIFFDFLGPESNLVWSRLESTLTLGKDQNPWTCGLIGSNIMEPMTQNAKDQNLVIINAKDIDLDRRLTFNLYIHLPKNKKFYLFVRRGRQLTTKRVERLGGAEHELFIQRNEFNLFRSYVFSRRLIAQLMSAHSPAA